MRLNLSNWCAFEDRYNLGEQLNSRGVYLIGRSVRRNTAPDTRSRKIIYIGRATNLRERLNTLENACAYYFASHAGGNSFHKSVINPHVKEQIAELREYCGNEEQARDLYVERCSEFQELWTRKRGRLSVAVWTPPNGGRGEFTRLLDEHQPTYVEVNLQADFLIRHDRLPKYNKRMG